MNQTSLTHEWLNSFSGKHKRSEFIKRLVFDAQISQRFYAGEIGDFVEGTKQVSEDDAETFRHLPFPKILVEGTVADGHVSRIIVCAEEIGCGKFKTIYATRSSGGKWTTSAPVEVSNNGGLGFSFNCSSSLNQMDAYQWGFSFLMRVCLALQCSNVGHQTVYPPKPRNSRSAKLPIFSHKILVIKLGQEVESGQNLGGTHASPRVHLRRGHIRKLQSGITVWVQPCVVGSSESGAVTKDYHLTA